MNVVLEFSGGAELLFGKVRQHQVALPTTSDNKTWTVGGLLHWIKDNILRERPELFLKDPAASELDVRPGILVLINEADWELMGQTEYALEVQNISSRFMTGFFKSFFSLQEGDTVAFISTLHGG